MSYTQLASNQSMVASLKQSVITRVSSAAGIDPSLVNIQRMYAGSVVLDVLVKLPPNPAGLGAADPEVLTRVETAIAAIASSATSTFDPTFQAQFGISSVSAVMTLSATAAAPSATLSSSSAPATDYLSIPVAVAVAGVCLSFLAAVVVVLVLVRRRQTNLKVASDPVMGCPSTMGISVGTPPKPAYVSPTLIRVGTPVRPADVPPLK